MRTVRLFVAAAALLLAGCVEAQETWVLDSKGGGTWSLTVRWNADLWRRAEGIVGRETLRRLEGRGFPLRAAEWRDVFDGIEGVEVDSVVESDLEGGRRELAVSVRFRSVADLLRCEVLSSRGLSVRLVGEEPAEAGETAPVAFEMDVRDEIPVLDRLAGLAAWRERRAGAEGDPGERRETPLDLLGVGEEDASLMAGMLAPAFAQVRIGFRFEVSGKVLAVDGVAAGAETRSADVAWNFLTLKRGDPRRVRFTWKPLAFDRPPLFPSR